MKSDGNNIEKTIVEKAKALGASVAGIARIEDLKTSKSFAQHRSELAQRFLDDERILAPPALSWVLVLHRKKCAVVPSAGTSKSLWVKWPDSQAWAVDLQ